MSSTVFSPASSRRIFANVLNPSRLGASPSRCPSAMVSLKDLPKSSVFTSRLPPDPLFPTAESSASAPRSALGPRLVKGALYTYVRPQRTPEPPQLLAVSAAACASLNLDPSEAATREFQNLVAGNGGFEEEVFPWAQCYGGWQFGQWAGQLGDGRAISLFEATNARTGDRYELQLKGAGLTPYSRFADGKAVLRSSVREFVVSEYLHAVGIPSTRALSLSLIPGETAVRERRAEPCAVVCRMAESWVRVGTFDLLRWRGDRKNLRALADYVHDEVLGLPRLLSREQEVKEEEEGEKEKEKDGRNRNRYEVMYREIVARNARTVARWQVYGFMNGVLNTDNTSILGLSLDFGPFAFMDGFDPSYTPNHDDGAGRYSFKNQPTIVWWNMVRLAEDVAELFAARDPDEKEFVENGVKGAEAEEELVKRAGEIIEECGEMYKAEFMGEYKSLMAARMGFKSCKETDMDDVFSPCLDLLEECELDFHHFFRRLSEVHLAPETDLAALAKTFLPEYGAAKTAVDPVGKIESFLGKYWNRLREEGGGGGGGVHDDEEERRRRQMKGLNPKFVPKNWVLDEIIERVEKKGDREVLGRVMECALNPFSDSWEGETGKEAERWCGDVPKQLRALQCSCSS